MHKMKVNMKLSSAVLLLNLLLVSVSNASDDQHGIYYAELQAFKKAKDTKFLFNEDAHPMLVDIQRDIATHKALNPIERLINVFFLTSDAILVTPDNLPLLYACVDEICKKGKAVMPAVFVTHKKSFFNAFAAKIAQSNGGIVIGQELLSKLSDDAIEAVLAHEIGHIKYNHVNKIYALQGACFIGALLLTQYCKPGFWKKVSFPKSLSEAEIYRFIKGLCILDIKFEAIYFVSSLMAAFVINKRFEKEADAFACQTIGKSSGLIEFFEYILRQDQLREEEFAVIHDMIEQSRADIFEGYYEFMMRYYWAKAEHIIFEGYKRLYYNTFWGAHPALGLRIEAAKKHLVF